MFLSLEVFAFEGQKKKFTMNMLLTCIYIMTPGAAVIRTVLANSR